MDRSVDIAAIKAAAKRIEGSAVRTPLMRNDALDEQTGARIYLKPECLQRTGSFKFRGAMNAISSLSGEERARGVVACSSGNHAQGIALAARLHGCEATIVMPSDAPEMKKANTAKLGGKIVEYDRYSEDRDAVAAEIVSLTGGSFVHPYNDSRVIAGQGTAGLEIAEDCRALGVVPDHLLVCTGGGGLTNGVLVGVLDAFPDCQVHTVEPEGYDDYRRSVESGYLQQADKSKPSLCDALLAPEPGSLGFSIGKDRLSSGLVVSDREALFGMRFGYGNLKLVLEPGGAVALAALLCGKIDVRGKNVVAILSGGNVDPVLFGQAISGR